MMAASTNLKECALSSLLDGLIPAPIMPELTVSGITLDSRDIKPQDLFLALAGARSHGLDFIDQAVKQGAAAVVLEAGGGWESARIARLREALKLPLIELPGLAGFSSLIAARFYGDPSGSMAVIGITGTNGKTSVCQFLAQALHAQTTCGIIGTLGWGFPGRLQSLSHTTPDAVTVQATLADLQQQGAKAVAMEVSSHALDQGRVAAVCFDTAVFTNISHDHLDYHGDFDCYYAAKRQLFDSSGLRLAIVNLNDPMGKELAHDLPSRVDVIGYGGPETRLTGFDQWIRAEKIDSHNEGLTLSLNTSQGRAELTVALLGEFNAFNLMAALGVLFGRGWTLTEAVDQLQSVSTVPGRMEAFVSEGRPLVVVDYAHTPDALEQALMAARRHCRRRLVCVFGCGGERDKAKRPLMGRVAERLADQVVITDDNPRGEAGETIVAAILQGMEQPDLARVERARAQAIQQTIAQAAGDDLILIAGKGHEEFQQVGDLKMRFSDREQVSLAMRRQEER